MAEAAIKKTTSELKSSSISYALRTKQLTREIADIENEIKRTDEKMQQIINRLNTTTDKRPGRSYVCFFTYQRLQYFDPSARLDVCVFHPWPLDRLPAERTTAVRHFACVLVVVLLLLWFFMWIRWFEHSFRWIFGFTFAFSLVVSGVALS